LTIRFSGYPAKKDRIISTCREIGLIRWQFDKEREELYPLASTSWVWAPPNGGDFQVLASKRTIPGPHNKY
jgi:hypothetical protein